MSARALDFGAIFAHMSRMDVQASSRAAFPGGAVPFLGSEFSDEEFQTVRDLLFEKRGFDLALYKDRCIKRRIAIRVRALGLSDARAYADVLRRDKDEADALLATLTIHVSQFFRNRSTFVALEQRILPELYRLTAAAGRREIRVWSVGCAGGEEPYSVALLVDEHRPPDLAVTILGSDVSPVILERAREGLYDAQRLVEVPQEALLRHFTPEGRMFRLKERVRRMVQFRRHDILRDLDYPSADLVLCRNVLIYFSRSEQENILRRMASCLSPEGFLVLGKAETLLGESRELYQIVDPAERIYRRL